MQLQTSPAPPPIGPGVVPGGIGVKGTGGPAKKLIMSLTNPTIKTIINHESYENRARMLVNKWQS